MQPVSSQSTPQLGGSWIFQSEEDDSEKVDYGDVDWSEDDPVINRLSENDEGDKLAALPHARPSLSGAYKGIRHHSRQRIPERIASRDEPYFIMPPMYEGQMVDSWLSTDRVFDRSPLDSQSSQRYSYSRQPTLIPMPSSTRDGNRKMRRHVSASATRPNIPKTKESARRMPKHTDNANFTSHVATIFDKAVVGVLHLFGLACEIIIIALRLSKLPIAIALAAFLLYHAGVAVRGSIAASIQASLSPLCQIPGAGLLNLPFCHHDHKAADHTGSSSSLSTSAARGLTQTSAPVEFEKLMQVQLILEQVMKTSVEYAALPHEMEFGHGALHTLRWRVHRSSLPSKNALVSEIDSLIKTSNEAVRDIMKLNSRVGGSLDFMITNTRWTTSVLGNIDKYVPIWYKSSIPPKLAALIPFYTPADPRALANEARVGQFLKHAELLEKQITKLEGFATKAVGSLGKVDKHLDGIRDIVARDEASMEASRDKILVTRDNILLRMWNLTGRPAGDLGDDGNSGSNSSSGIWGRIGSFLGFSGSSPEQDAAAYNDEYGRYGRRQRLLSLAREIERLKRVSMYHDIVWRQVSDAVRKLDTMSLDLQTLRGQVTESKEAKHVPMIVHLETMRLGLERLAAARLEASQAADARIQAAIERLGRGELLGEKRIADGDVVFNT